MGGSVRVCRPEGPTHAGQKVGVSAQTVRQGELASPFLRRVVLLTRTEGKRLSCTFLFKCSFPPETPSHVHLGKKCLARYPVRLVHKVAITSSDASYDIRGPHSLQSSCQLNLCSFPVQGFAIMTHGAQKSALLLQLCEQQRDVSDGSVVKHPPAVQETRGCEFDPGSGRSPWRRKWQPTPAFLPGKSHGQKSPAGDGPGGRNASHTAEWPSMHTRVLVESTEHDSERTR